MKTTCARPCGCFPLYLIVINLFVLPIAFGGMLKLGHTGLDADTYVLALPLAAGHSWLGAAHVPGGLVGGQQHDYRRNHCPERDDEQPPAHAAAGARARRPPRQPDALVCLPGPRGPRKPPAGRGAGAAAGLRLLRRSGPAAPAGEYRAGVVRGRGAVRAGGAGRAILEGRHPARGHGGPAGGFHGVVLHAGAAHPGGAGPPARIGADGRSGAYFGIAAVCAVRARRARLFVARPVLELAVQHWPLRGPLAGLAAVGAGAAAGRRVRRRVHPAAVWPRR